MIKRYHAIIYSKPLSYFSDNNYAVWDETLGKFIGNCSSNSISIQRKCDKLNAEHELYIKALSESLNQEINII